MRVFGALFVSKSSRDREIMLELLGVKYTEAHLLIRHKSIRLSPCTSSTTQYQPHPLTSSILSAPKSYHTHLSSPRQYTKRFPKP